MDGGRRGGVKEEEGTARNFHSTYEGYRGRCTSRLYRKQSTFAISLTLSAGLWYVLSRKCRRFDNFSILCHFTASLLSESVLWHVSMKL